MSMEVCILRSRTLDFLEIYYASSDFGLDRKNSLKLSAKGIKRRAISR
jgi:hypothetical protein